MNPVSVPKASPLLQRTLMTGICSMVPVPFLDDLLITKTRKGLVHRILRDHSLKIPVSELETYYAGFSRGCLIRTVGLVFTVIRKVLRKILRTVFFFLAIRRATLEMTETFLLGRTLDRCIQSGLLDGDSLDRQNVEAMRTAFESANRRSDLRMFAGAMRSAWVSIAGNRSVVRSLVQRFRKDAQSVEEDELQPADLSQSEQDVLEKGEAVLAEKLEKSRVKEFLHSFDARFDKAFTETQIASR